MAAGALTARAVGLIREMISHEGSLPAYNEEVIRVTLEQIDQCNEAMNKLHITAREVAQREHEARNGNGSDFQFDWGTQPERFAAVIIHHETIIKLKRVLLTYMALRAEALKRIRWDQRHLPQDVRANLSPAEVDFYKDYDRALAKYMGPAGISLDLTLDLSPPKDVAVRVKVLRDHGSLATSRSSKVDLVKGSVHRMPCSEAEHLIRLGVLQPLDNLG